LIPRDLLLVAFSLLIWGVGEGMFTYFQPIYLQQWGASPVTIGLILGAMGISMTVAQAPAGYLSDRIGPRPVMWASWVFALAATILMASATSLSLFVVGLLCYGLTSFVIAPMNAYLVSVRGNWSVERALTLPSALFNLGMVIGPILGGLIAEGAGIRRIYFFSAILFLISTGMIFFIRRAPADEHHETTVQRPNLLRNPRYLGLLGLIMLTTFSLYLPQPLTPNFLQNEVGLPLHAIGQLGAIGSLGNALIGLGLGHLSAPFGFLTGTALMGVFSFLMWQGQSVTAFAIGYFFVGGFRLTRAMGLAYARYFIRSTETGLAFGLIETANGLAVIFAPMLAGRLYEADPRSVYLTSLVLILVLIVVNSAIRVRRATQPAFPSNRA